MFMDIGKYTGGRPTTHWDSSELVSDTLLSPPTLHFPGVPLWFLVQEIYMLSPLPLKARLLGKEIVAFIQCSLLEGNSTWSILGACNKGQLPELRRGRWKEASGGQ